MDKCESINDRQQKLSELKLLLSDIDNKLLVLTREFNWDYGKLLEERPSSMAICSVNPQHRVPISKLKIHEQKCSLHHMGYLDSEKFFPEPSGAGSSITLTSETLFSVTKNVSPCTENKIREIPQTSANFDQNFNREEKLAIYNYVVANTLKQKSYSDLWLQPEAKMEEKREMSAWEIAAAERDAKRRRASYRNKVHTNRKTHTEILREVIEAQMEAFREEGTSSKTEDEKAYEKAEGHKRSYRKSSHEYKETSDKHQIRCHQTSSWGHKEDRDQRRNHEKHFRHRDRKRSPPDTGSDIKSRSRSRDKYRKWKNYEGRSHSHRSSHSHSRR